MVHYHWIDLVSDAVRPDILQVGKIEEAVTKSMNQQEITIPLAASTCPVFI